MTVVWDANPGASVRQIVRFYIYFATLPSGDTPLFEYGSDGNGPKVSFKQSDSKLYAAVGATLGAAGVAVTTGQWYRIDADFNVNTGGTDACDVQVDGTACGQATAAGTVNSSSSNTVGVKSAVTADVFYEDGLTSATAADYPLGPGYVNHFVPTSDGTHNTGAAGTFIRGTAGVNITNSTTDSYLLVDEVPLDGPTTPTTDDFITQALIGATNYTENIYGPASGIGVPSVAPRAVDVTVAYHQAATQTGVSAFKLNDNGTENTIVALNGSGVTTLRYSVKQYATAPTGGAWTVVSGNGNFNNLRIRFGYSSDATPDQYFDGSIIEAEFAPAAARTTKNTRAFPLGTEIGMNWIDGAQL